jgi:Na+-transporting NADH:ubiquinone oxidoreductase subunit NqrD
MSLARAVWEFVVGDDWVTALGVVVALAVTALLSAWWVMAVAVPLLLAVSLRRAAG